MPKIIFLAGLMSAGKTTLADILTGIAISLDIRPQLLKFADPLYHLQSEVYKLIGQPAVKNRKLMQGMGDAIRDHVGDDYFVKTMETAINRSLADIVIVDDMRFPIELDLAKKLGAVTVQIEAPADARESRGRALGTWSPSGHRTEMGLPSDQFDHVIVNDGDLSDLNLKALELWTKLGVRPPESEPAEPDEDFNFDEEGYCLLVDALLQKHFGITIDDTDLEEKIFSEMLDGSRPFETVNEWAKKRSLERLDKKGHCCQPVPIPLKSSGQHLLEKEVGYGC